MSKYVIGVDVGGTSTSYGVFDTSKKLIKKISHPSDSTLDSQNFFDVIVKNIKALVDGINLSTEDLHGIGIGMPSFINSCDGFIIKTTNLTKICNFPAKDYLLSKLGDKTPIFIDNDSHTGALAEHRQGAGRGFKNMLYCLLSTGISSGIIINDSLFCGDYGWSGESGHMIATPGEGIMCGCGNIGCFMSYCSGSMIIKHIKKWIAQGEETVMTEMVNNLEELTTIHLNEACENGDLMACKALEQMTTFAATWLYNLYVTLNINCFVLGGGLLNMGEKLLSNIESKFHSYNQNDMPVYFKKAELSEDFGIIGAAELVFQK